MTVKKFIILAIISITLLLTLPPTTISASTTQDGFIAGIVWNDINNNHIQETYEVGIEGVTIYVQRQGTEEQQIVQTAGGGGFAVLDLELGLYSIWCEYEDVICYTSEVELDELNGISSVEIPLELSITQADTRTEHTVYLPLIHN